MDITPESKLSRLQLLRHTFSRLAEFYQRKNLTIAWAVDNNGAEINPDYLWNKYARDVASVRNDFMRSSESRIDRHKIIALTELVILEVQPLVFVRNDIASNDHYRLNVEFAFLFGLQFITRWHEVYNPAPFFSESFLYPITHMEEGIIFRQEHFKLLMLHSKQPIPIFWASQLWFLLEQWGLSYMREASRFPANPNR
jgi:hypothetical protein